MKDTKEYFGKDKGRQCYHVIISYRPGEITPELALQIAGEFARENLSDYEVVIAVHKEAEKLRPDGVPGMEAERPRYADAVAVLETCGIPKESLAREKAELYEEIAAVNREIREQRKKLEMCAEILSKTPEIETNLQKIEPKRRERRKMRTGR